ncbi:hypothetical protein KL937_001298 [Ogataea polymorpha]|nr:hypothetical protein KL937_001298 [Ogataea polymorpha]
MEVLKLLQSLGDENKKDLMRRSVEVFTCTICQELMVTPFTVTCGHTFCYECLSDWLKVKHSCPLCRQRVRRVPVFNVPMKQLLESYLEAVAKDHPDQKEPITKMIRERNKLYEKDNHNDTCFKNLFDNYSEAVLDTSDGIPRCSVCHWEAHGSRCLNCGRRLLAATNERFSSSDSEDDPEYHDESASYGEESFISLLERESPELADAWRQREALRLFINALSPGEEEEDDFDDDYVDYDFERDLRDADSVPSDIDDGDEYYRPANTRHRSRILSSDSDEEWTE